MLTRESSCSLKAQNVSLIRAVCSPWIVNTNARAGDAVNGPHRPHEQKSAAKKIQTMCRDVASLMENGALPSYTSSLSLTRASLTGRPSCSKKSKCPSQFVWRSLSIELVYFLYIAGTRGSARLALFLRNLDSPRILSMDHSSPRPCSIRWFGDPLISLECGIAICEIYFDPWTPWSKPQPLELISTQSKRHRERRYTQTPKRKPETKL